MIMIMTCTLGVKIDLHVLSMCRRVPLWVHWRKCKQGCFCWWQVHQCNCDSWPNVFYPSRSVPDLILALYCMCCCSTCICMLGQDLTVTIIEWYEANVSVYWNIHHRAYLELTSILTTMQLYYWFSSSLHEYVWHLCGATLVAQVMLKERSCHRCLACTCCLDLHMICTWTCAGLWVTTFDDCGWSKLICRFGSLWNKPTVWTSSVHCQLPHFRSWHSDHLISIFQPATVCFEGYPRNRQRDHPNDCGQSQLHWTSKPILWPRMPCKVQHGYASIY